MNNVFICFSRCDATRGKGRCDSKERPTLQQGSADASRGVFSLLLNIVPIVCSKGANRQA